MGKVTKKLDCHVVVETRSSGDYGFCSIGGDTNTFERKRDICDRLVTQIMRHVSKFDDDRGDVYVHEESGDFCAHCGADWTASDPDYNGCCDEDEREYHAKQEAAA